MVGLLEAPRYLYGWPFRGPPVFSCYDSQRLPGFLMVGLSEAPRYSYGLTLSGPRFSYGWIQRPHGCRMVGLRGPTVVVWLDSQRPPVSS